MRRSRARRGKQPKNHSMVRTLKRMRAREEKPRNPFSFADWAMPAISQVIAQAPVISDLFKTVPTIPLDIPYETDQNRAITP